MQLLPKQNKAYTKLVNNKVCALFMKMGTGKTRVCVELVNSFTDIELVVYVAPLSIIKPKDGIEPICNEVNKWGGFKAKEVVYIGVESIGMSDRIYLEIYNKIRSFNPENVVIVVDESIKIKNHDSKRTKRLLELSKYCENKIILNGEPITRDLLDLWSQFQFLDPEIINMNLAEFKNTFCKYTTITKQITPRKSYTKEFITGYENIDYLYSLVGEYIFECDLDLDVQQIFETATYSLSESDLKNYNYLKEKYLDDEKLLAMNNNIFLEMTQKMQHEYSCTYEKFLKVDEWFKNYPESKSIIFCNYIVSANECRERYPNALVLNYNSCYGHNLQDRPVTVLFDQTFDWGKISQGTARNFRTGVESDCRYLSLVANVGLGSLYLKNNDKKIGISEYLKKTSKEQLKSEL